jgi:hypothetical protein
MIEFIGTSIKITTNQNSSQSMTEQDFHSLLDHDCLLFHCDWFDSDLRSVTSSASVVRWFALHSWTLNYWTAFWILLRLNDWRMNSRIELSLVESYITTDGQSASLSWNKTPICGLRSDFYYC